MKNFMKKFCSFALSIAMLLSSLAPAAIAEDDNHSVEMNDTELVSPFSVIGKLTVYSEPDANSLVLGSYSAEELNITDSNAFGWIRVSISGIEGYVYISAPQSVAENIQRSDNENESIKSTVTGNATLLEADNVATDTETEAPTLENVKDEQDELDLVNNEDDGADETSKPVDTVVEQTDNLEESDISTGNHEESDPDLPIVEDGEVSTNEDVVSVSEDDEPGQETTCVDENEKQTGDVKDSTIPDENPGKSDIELQVSEDEEEEENVGEENGLVIEDDELEQETTPEDETPEQAGNVEESTIPAEDPEESDIEFWVGEDEDQDENIGEGNGLVIEDDELEQVTTPVDEVPEQTGNVEESTISAEDLEESDIEFQVGEDKDKEESSSEENEFVFADDEPGQEIAPVVDEATEQTKDEENSGIPADEPDESDIDSWLVVDEDEEENTSDGNELVIEDDEPGQEIAPVDEALEQTGDVENSCVPADESDIDSWLVVDEDEEEIASEENDIVIEDDEPEQETMPVDEATEQTDDMENSGIFTDEHEESDLDFLVIDDETEEESDKDSDLTTELMVEKSDNTTSGFETVLLDVYPLETSEKPVREPDTGLLMASGIGLQPNMGIKLMSVNIDTETDNHVMGIHVDNIIVGNSFGISWDSVKYADHYEIAVVRIDADGQETYVTSGTSHRKNTGSSCSYTVSASDVPDDTVRFRIYVGAASTGYPCDSSNMIKDNTVTITARYAKNQDMDVTISVDEDGGYVYWSKVSNTDYYVYSVYDITDSQYIYNRAETTSKSFDIDSADVISGHKYRVWVGAYDASDTLLAQHQAEVILQVNCPHDVTMKKDLYGYYEEDEITDKYHTLYNVYNVVCKSCGKVLKENQVESLGEEEHEYSTEGVCIICHYAGGECLHVDTSKVYTRTEYEPEDEDTHTMIKHFDVVCDYCEAVIPLRLDELYSRDRTERTEGLSHSFKNGTCEKCGYIKAPELTITLQRGQSSAEVGEAISANASIAGGSGTYQVIWKVYCDNVCVNDDVTGAWISGIEHSASYSASHAGTWYFEATVYDSADTANYVTAKTQTIIVTEPTCDHEYETIDQTELTEYENVNDSQHRIIYHHASVCSICKDVKSTWTSDAFEAHKFDNSGKCVCGAVKETDPDCVHEWNSTVKEIKVEQTTMNDRMEKHKVTTVYSDYCSKCGSQDSHEVVEYVAHVFDKNGYCECGYVEVTDECDHATTGIPEGDAVYEVINNRVHSVTTYERHKCACGQVNELRETTVQMPHTFVDGFCVCGLADPGPACPHLTTDVTWDTKYSVTYKSISDTEHSMSGYMYEYCTECLERIGESYAVTKNYKHTFDDAGDCIDCDYRAGCQHTETIKKYEDTTYTSIDEKYHKVTDFYSLVCADCGKVLVALDSSLKVTSEEEHQFDGNACTLCDYVKADALTVSVVAGQDTANAGETISAKATIAGGSGKYNISWAITLDGIAIDQTDMSMGNSYSYVADKAGSYVFTVDVKDSAGNTQTASSSAIVVTVTHNWKTVTSTEFINQSDKYHDIVTTTYEECTICGEKTQPVVTTQSVEHVTVRTGYEAAHPHQKFNVCRDCSAHPLIGNSYQTANGKVQSADECCICHGHVWLTDEPDEVNGEQRVYCVNCGLTKITDTSVEENYCDHTENRTEKSPIYLQYNENHHIKSIEVTYSCTCGQVCRSETEFSTEKHLVTNGICSLCGYNVDPFENTTVSSSKVENLINQANNSIIDTFNELAQEKESGLQNLASEALKILTDPVGGTYNAVMDGAFGKQEKDVLERAVIEMLYGIEYGNTTFSELSQIVEKDGSFVGDFAFNVMSEVKQHKTEGLSSVIQSKADSVYFAMSATGQDPKRLLEPIDFSPENLDHLIDSYDRYLENFEAAEGTDLRKAQSNVKKDLLDLKELSNENDSAKNTKTSIDAIGIGVDAFFTLVSVTLNYFVADEQVEKTLSSENAALHAVASEKVQKIEILTDLMTKLDKNSALYMACEQVRKDIQNDLEGFLSSTYRRKALRESGKDVIEFSCGVAVAIEPVTSKALGGLAGNVLATSAIANVASNIITGGGVSDAIDYAETIENLTFVHNALLGMDTSDMSFFETELYYTLSKKQLDYASEMNMLVHGDSWIKRQDEEEKLSIDMGIVRAQRNLLNSQNAIRAEYFANNGIPFKAENGFDAGVINSYFMDKYDLVVNNEEIPVYVDMQFYPTNIVPVSATLGFQPVGTFRKLEKHSKYEIVAVLEKDGVDYLKIEDTKGVVSYVKVSDVPNGRKIVQDKYSLNIKSGSYIPVYLVKDTGFIGDIVGEKDFMYQNSDYAVGDYEMIRVVQYNEEYYYQVRDICGSEWYLKVADVQDLLQ